MILQKNCLSQINFNVIVTLQVNQQISGVQRCSMDFRGPACVIENGKLNVLWHSTEFHWTIGVIENWKSIEFNEISLNSGFPNFHKTYNSAEFHEASRVVKDGKWEVVWICREFGARNMIKLNQQMMLLSIQQCIHIYKYVFVLFDRWLCVTWPFSWEMLHITLISIL